MKSRLASITTLLVVICLVLLASICIRYSATLVVAEGLVLACLVHLFVQRFGTIWSVLRPRMPFIYAAIACLGVVFLCTNAMFITTNEDGANSSAPSANTASMSGSSTKFTENKTPHPTATPPPHYEIKNYRALVQTKDLKQFYLTETAWIEGAEVIVGGHKRLLTLRQGFPFTQKRLVPARRISLFLSEVRFSPFNCHLEESADAHVTIVPPRVRKSRVASFSESCPVCVSIAQFPANSFYKAFNPNKEIKPEPAYIDTENIQWACRNTRSEIAFAYVPGSWRELRKMLDPILGLSSLGDWVLFILAFSIPLIVVDVMKPLIVDSIKKKIKKRMGGDEEKEDGEKKQDGASD